MEKTPDVSRRMGAETTAVYAKHKVNPLMMFPGIFAQVAIRDTRRLYRRCCKGIADSAD